MQKPKEEAVTPNEDVKALPAEFKAYHDILNKKPVLTLGSIIYDNEGKEIPQGHYQLSYKDGEISFVQGFETLGYIKAQRAKDEFGENEIIFARAIKVNDNVIKIFFSDSKDCYEGFARIRN